MESRTKIIFKSGSLFAGILLFICFTNQLTAQSIHVENFTESEGLLSSHAYNTIQDKNGRMWFATRRGICRFDGTNWNYYTFPEDLERENNGFFNLDSSGTLWCIDKVHGFFAHYFDGAVWKPYRFKNHSVLEKMKLYPTSFKVIINESDTTFAIGSSIYGLILYKNEKWIFPGKENGFPLKRVDDLFVFNNIIYSVSDKGLARIIDNHADYSLNLLLPNNSKNLLSVYVENENKIWVLAQDYIGFIHDNRFHKVSDRFFLERFRNTEKALIQPYKGDKVFFANIRKFCIVDINTGSLIALDENSGMVNTRGAIDIFQDREYNIWVSGGYGVSKISQMKFVNFNSSHGLYRNEVTSISEISSGQLVFGHDYGVSYLDENGISNFSFADYDKLNSGYSRIQDFHKYKNNLWLAVENFGFGKFISNKKIKWYKNSDPMGTMPTSIISKKDGTIFGLTEKSLQKFDESKKKFIFTGLEKKIDEGYLRKLFLSPTEKIFISTSSTGIVYEGDSGNWKSIKSEIPFKNNVYSVYFGDKDTLAGTIGGLCKIEGDSLKVFKQNGFSIRRPIYFINNDNSNNLWFGTDKGLVVWNGDKYVTYDVAHGLSGLETNRDAFFQDSKGDIWIGTNGGVSKFIGSPFDSNNVSPILEIGSIIIDTLEIKDKKDIKLEAGDHNLIFNINVISFINRSANCYRYRLVGLSSDWIEQKNHEITEVRYLHVPPGNYRFEVQAHNANGVCSDIISSQEIIIAEPFYNKSWFYLVVLLLGIVLVLSIFRVLFIRRYAKKLEIEVKNRTNELKEAKNRYSQMFTSNRAIMLIIEPESGKIIDANPAALVYYGYSKAILLNMSFKNIDHLYDEEYEVYTGNEETSTNYYQTQHHLADNKMRDVEVYFTVVNYDGNNLLYAIVHDISERTIAEKALLESEEKYRILIGSIQDGVFVMKDDIFVYLNDAVLPILGYTNFEMTGKSIVDIVHPDERDKLTDRLNRRRSGEISGNAHFEIRMLHKQGATKYMMISIDEVEYEGELALIGTAKDITQIRRNEDSLRKLSMAVEQSPVSIIITDSQGKIEYVNPRFNELTGYNLTEVFGKNPSMLKSGNTSLDVYENMWNTISSGNVWSGDLLNRNKDGELFWISAIISPVKDVQGNITNYLAVEEDITFDKFAKDELKRHEELFNSVLSNVPVVLYALNKEGKITLARGRIIEDFGFNADKIIGRPVKLLFRGMEDINKDIKRALNAEEFKTIRKVKNRTFENSFTPIFDDENNFVGSIGISYDISESENVKHELLKAKEHAETSDRLKSEFLAQMSHEIRTPINSILSFTSLLKAETEELVSNEMKQSYQIIDSGGRRLIRTIDLILNMSQIQTGTYKPQFEKLCLKEDILDGVIAELDSTANAKGLALECDYQIDSTEFDGDLYTVGQIFVNLIENALKYTEEGSVNVVIHNNGKSNLIVDIIDTGIGISNEFIPQLFSPFSQEESGYTRKFEGTGLGLALVKNYASVNNISIEVESEKGVGSTFSVIFPQNNIS